MIPRPHHLATTDFAALATGGGGGHVMRTLSAVRRSRTLQLIRLIITNVDTNDVAAHQAYRALAEVHGRAPEAVDRVLTHPSVGAWATRTGLRLLSNEPIDTETLTGIAAASAIRGRVAVTLRVPADGDLVLPSLGVATGVPAGTSAVRFDTGGVALGDTVRIPRDWSAEGPRWRPTPRITVRSEGLEARFHLERTEVYQPTSAVPPPGEPDLSAWRNKVAASWRLLVRHHREVADELAAGVPVLAPLQTAAGSSSATVEDAFGCILLSLDPEPESMAVSLAHELRHNKLIALLDLFPLLHPTPGKRFYAPWRDDPRPLLGLLHGTYAYVGVTAFWRRQRFHQPTPPAEAYAHTEFARWRRSALAATRTLLDSGGLTPTGHTFVTLMARTLDQWCAEPVPASAEAEAARLSTSHRETYRDRNPAH